MMRRAPLKPGFPLKSNGFARADRKEAQAVGKLRKAAPARKASMKTRQRTVTPAEKLFWDRLASLGCIACMKDGRYNPHVSIHHVDGRTKPGCHLLVLPLCGPHHQDDGSGVIAVHPWKARFEARYGSQFDLVDECRRLLAGTKNIASFLIEKSITSIGSSKSEATNGLQPAVASIKTSEEVYE